MTPVNPDLAEHTHMYGAIYNPVDVHVYAGNKHSLYMCKLLLNIVRYWTKQRKSGLIALDWLTVTRP